MILCVTHKYLDQMGTTPCPDCHEQVKPEDGDWIQCQHCGIKHIAATFLIRHRCCFSCYMKGYGPGGPSEGL